MPRIVWVYPLTILGIAFAAIFVRLALPAPPTITGFYRMFFAAIAMAAWAALARRRVLWRGRAAAFALASGVCFGLDLAFWHTSIVLTSVGLATLLVNLTPVHLGVYAVTVRRERLAPRFVAGAALALAGMVLLLGVPGLHASGHAGGLRGAGFAIVASLFYAGYLLLMSEARREMDAFDALLLMTLASAGVLATVALAAGNPFGGFSASSWAAMLGCALLTQVGGVLGVVWLLRHLPPTYASVTLLAQPVCAALLAWLLLGEAIGPLQTAGGAVVLAGIALAAVRGA
ncbi:MAG TPA: DMT family transporter [Myxococcota bacterium]|nr:DMT family transporter [Myxococcota bacterium]